MPKRALVVLVVPSWLVGMSSYFRFKTPAESTLLWPACYLVRPLAWHTAAGLGFMSVVK